MADDSNKVEIKVNADVNNAESGLSRVRQGLQNIKFAITGVTRTLASLNWAMMAVQAIIGWMRRLREWMNRAATAARELTDRLERNSIAAEAAHAAEAYKKLNKELAEANRLEKERNAILDQRKATTRDLEDAQLERSKQLEIAKLDPMSATYDEDRAVVERKYARQASQLAATRAGEDSRAQARQLYAEADAKDVAANKQQAAYERQVRVVDRLVEQAWKSGMDARRGVEGAAEKAAEDDAAWRQAQKAAMEIKDAMETLRKEAESIRARAAELIGGGRAANIRNEATQLSLDNEERDAAARKEQAAKDAAEREAELSRRAKEREDAQTRQNAERGIVEAESQIAGFESAIGSVAPSGNRLTAMGLGAGAGVARVQEQMAASLKDLVKAAKVQIEELRAIKDAPNVAVFGE